MANMVRCDELGLAICEALGIPTENIAGVSLTFLPGQAAEARIIRLLTDKDLQNLRTVVERYEVVPRE